MLLDTVGRLQMLTNNHTTAFLVIPAWCTGGHILYVNIYMYVVLLLKVLASSVLFCSPAPQDVDLPPEAYQIVLPSAQAAKPPVLAAIAQGVEEAQASWQALMQQDEANQSIYGKPVLIQQPPPPPPPLPSVQGPFDLTNTSGGGASSLAAGIANGTSGTAAAGAGPDRKSTGVGRGLNPLALNGTANVNGFVPEQSDLAGPAAAGRGRGGRGSRGGRGRGRGRASSIAAADDSEHDGDDSDGDDDDDVEVDDKDAAYVAPGGSSGGRGGGKGRRGGRGGRGGRGSRGGRVGGRGLRSASAPALLALEATPIAAAGGGAGVYRVTPQQQQDDEEMFEVGEDGLDDLPVAVAFSKSRFRSTGALAALPALGDMPSTGGGGGDAAVAADAGTPALAVFAGGLVPAAAAGESQVAEAAGAVAAMALADTKTLGVAAMQATSAAAGTDQHDWAAGTAAAAGDEGALDAVPPVAAMQGGGSTGAQPAVPIDAGPGAGGVCIAGAVAAEPQQVAGAQKAAAAVGAGGLANSSTAEVVSPVVPDAPAVEAAAVAVPALDVERSQKSEGAVVGTADALPASSNMDATQLPFLGQGAEMASAAPGVTPPPFLSGGGQEQVGDASSSRAGQERADGDATMCMDAS